RRWADRGAAASDGSQRPAAGGSGRDAGRQEPGVGGAGREAGVEQGADSGAGGAVQGGRGGVSVGPCEASVDESADIITSHECTPTPPAQLDYASPSAANDARSKPPKAATVLGLTAMILGVGGTVTSWLGIESQRGNPFPFAAIFCVVIWVGSNVIALV